MRLIKLITPALVILTLACEVAELTYNNPLDVEDTAAPALVFRPNAIETSVGGSAVFEVFAVQVTGVSGIHTQISYDNSQLGVTNVSPGDFFDDATQAPMFFTVPANPSTATGTLDIYYFFLGDGLTKDGTGAVATVIFNTKLSATSTLEFTAESEFVDPDDLAIQINSLGQGTVTAQ